MMDLARGNIRMVKMYTLIILNFTLDDFVWAIKSNNAIATQKADC